MFHDFCDKIYGGCNFENTLNQTKKFLFQKAVANCGLSSKPLHYHQYFTDFTYFMSLARELILQSWLTF